MSDKLHAFRTGAITVTWSSRRCIHAAACVAGLPHVFAPGEKPWIRLEGADAGAVDATVRRCPTGALHAERHDGGAPEAPEANNVVLVTAGGPLHVRGDVVLRGADGAALLADTRVALCRCGASANKPLCDGAHRESGFADAGAIRDLDAVQDAGAAPEGARLVVHVEPNGPLHLEGPFVLASADGTVLLEGTSAWLCRCGRSKDRPFCDGSHESAPFE